MQALIGTMEYIQSEDVYGKGFIAGALQMVLAYGYQLGCWLAFGHLATEYVMLPAKIVRYIGSALHELRMRRAFRWVPALAAAAIEREKEDSARRKLFESAQYLRFPLGAFCMGRT